MVNCYNASDEWLWCRMEQILHSNMIEAPGVEGTGTTVSTKGTDPLDLSHSLTPASTLTICSPLLDGLTAAMEANNAPPNPVA